MKKLLFLLLSISLLTACKNDKTKSSRDTEKTSKDDYRNGNEGNDKGQQDDGKDAVDRNSGNNDDVVDDNEEGNHVAEGANWSSSDISDFTNECVNAAVKKGLEKSTSQTYCNCMLRKLTTQYPDKNDAAKIDMESPVIKAMIEDCGGVATQNPSTSSSSQGWSRKQELDFVNGCVREAKNGGMEDLDAQSYCDCMQYKIEKLYPSFADANKLSEADLKKPSMQKMIQDCLPGN